MHVFTLSFTEQSRHKQSFSPYTERLFVDNRNACLGSYSSAFGKAIYASDTALEGLSHLFKVF